LHAQSVELVLAVDAVAELEGQLLQASLPWVLLYPVVSHAVQEPLLGE
jgi:hypothetical protein